MSNTPRNGRIAIVDDEFEQALPIIKALSKRRIPSTYYSGAVEELPEENESTNDIRVLFLDINLLPSTSSDDKAIKASIIGVINRIISDRNIPYVLVYWSRKEDDYKSIIEEVFQTLQAKKPISYLSLQKANYFTLNGDLINDDRDLLSDIWDKILLEMSKNPVFDLLMCWENLVHKSADETLDALLQVYPVDDRWNDNTQDLFYALAEAYSGKHIKDHNLTDIIRSGFSTVNMLFQDSVEFDTYKVSPPHLIEEFKKNGTLSNDAARLLNEKLLFSDVFKGPDVSGVMSLNTAHFNYEGIFSDCLNRQLIGSSDICREYLATEDCTTDQKLKKALDKYFKKFRSESKHDREGIIVNVTPLCDHVQKKSQLNRIIPGLLLKINLLQYVNKKTEFLYISPVFRLNTDKVNGDYFLLLDFRFFTACTNTALGNYEAKPIRRLRIEVLTEIISNLTRHMSRPGILYLPDNE